MNYLLLKIIRSWIPIAVVVTCVSLILYILVQQDIRQGANDPQIQIAEDIAASLNADKPYTLTSKINIGDSLAPFTMIFDKLGNVINSEAVLDSNTPVLPNGVLAASIKLQENRLTWQPTSEVRIATVIVPFKNGFILVGRNMREVERREEVSLHLVLLGLAGTLVLSLCAVFFVQIAFSKKRHE